MDDITEDYGGHSKGTYSYKILPMPIYGPLELPMGRTIKIGTETYTVTFGEGFSDFYKGPVMCMQVQNNGTLTLGTLILASVSTGQ